MGELNLLVSSSPRVSGRARREIITRLRSLGDEAPEPGLMLTRGIRAVGTSLDPRQVVADLRALCVRSPGRFRFTWRWVPVDLWTGTDLESMKQGVARLRGKIQPGETWRMTLEKRTPDGLDARETIVVLAALIDARVDLSHPDKILLVDIFDDRVALAVLAPWEVFSVVKAREAATGGARPGGPPS
jgi:tRNA(Ser,Leu) C12 N-acetylase TAN1